MISNVLSEAIKKINSYLSDRLPVHEALHEEIYVTLSTMEALGLILDASPDENGERAQAIEDVAFVLRDLDIGYLRDACDRVYDLFRGKGSEGEATERRGRTGGIPCWDDFVGKPMLVPIFLFGIDGVDEIERKVDSLEGFCRGHGP